MDDTGLAQGTVFALALAGAGVAILAATTDRRDRRFQVLIFLAAFALRFGFSALIYAGGLVEVLKDEDGSGWVAGVGIARRWEFEEGLSPADLPGAIVAGAYGARTHNLGYYYLLAALFFATGCPYRMVAAALNCSFGAMTVVLTYRIAGALFSARVARSAARYTCLFPSLITWSAMTIKEPVVIALESLALYCCLGLRAGRAPVVRLVSCAATVVLLVPFRFYASYMVGLSAVFGLTLPRSGGPRRVVRNAAVVAGLIVLAASSGLAGLSDRESELVSLDRVEHFRHSVSRGNLGSGSGVATGDVRTAHGLLLGVLIGGMHLMLAPFPWQLGGASVRMLLTLPELLVWWWLFFRGFLPGLRVAVEARPRDMAVFLVFISGFGLLYSLTFGNVGLVFRQRAQLLPWLLIVSAVGLEWRGTRPPGGGASGLRGPPGGRNRGGPGEFLEGGRARRDHI